MTEQHDPLQRNGAVTAIIAHISTVRDDLIREIEVMKEEDRRRWAAHLADYRRLRTSVERHHHEADEDRVVTEARVRPVLTAFQTVAKNWRTILLVVVSVLAILGFSGETLNKLLGT